MPYTVGSFASIILFVSMFVGLRPHFVALQEAARTKQHFRGRQRVTAFTTCTKPVSPEDFSATRAPFAEQSPSLNPGGALAALTSSYAHPHQTLMRTQTT